MRHFGHQVTNAIDIVDSGCDPLLTMFAIDDRPNAVRIQTTNEFEILAEVFQAMPALNGMLRFWMAIRFEIRIEGVFVEYQG